MKSFQIIAAFMFLFAGVQTVNAQTKSGGTKSTVKTSTFKVWGNCGMCKTTIEGAAKKSGATYANWNVDTKVMTVKYASTKTSEDKIQKGIADAGYDNVKYTGVEEAYNNLHECCKYDRKAAASAEAKACCMKDSKCTGDKDCCKKEGTGTVAMKDMKCEKGADCCKKTN